MKSVGVEINRSSRVLVVIPVIYCVYQGEKTIWRVGGTCSASPGPARQYYGTILSIYIILSYCQLFSCKMQHINTLCKSVCL